MRSTSLVPRHSLIAGEGREHHMTCLIVCEVVNLQSVFTYSQGHLVKWVHVWAIKVQLYIHFWILYNWNIELIQWKQQSLVHCLYVLLLKASPSFWYCSFSYVYLSSFYEVACFLSLPPFPELLALLGVSWLLLWPSPMYSQHTCKAEYNKQ